MKQNENAVQVFRQFAEERLKNHAEELKTHYQNEKIDEQTKIKAYDQHREIYSQELNEKMRSLSNSDIDPWLKNQIENMKSVYITKLAYNQCN